jgi:hypothetical protein
MIAEKIANAPKGGGPKYPKESFISYETATKLAGSNRTNIIKARLARKWAPVEAEEVETGNMELGTAFQMAQQNKRQAEQKEKPEKQNSNSKSIELTGIIDKY